MNPYPYKEEIEQANVYYEESNSYDSIDEHFHYQHELIMVTEGCAEFIINGKTHIVTKDSLVIIGNLEQHKIKALQCPYKRYVLSISNELCLLMIREPLLLSILLHRPKNFSYVIDLTPDLSEEIKRHFDILINECNQKQELWTTRVALFVTDILLLLYRNNAEAFAQNKDTSAIQTVIKIQEYIAKNYKQEILLKDLADKYYISEFYLSRVFKEVTGYGFKEYLILYRLNEAKKLLCSTNLSVTDICYAVGYSNVNHFIRIFRQREGMSPLKYRKKCIIIYN
jgi:AraC-like DNA-binding protein